MQLFHVKRAAAAWLLVVSLGLGAAERVRIPADGLELEALVYRPAGEGPFGAVVLMHGCSGMWRPDGRPNASYDDWAVALSGRGFVALLLDSFGTRGEKEICTQGVRRVSAARDRPGDAAAARAWLARQPEIEPSRIHLMGWSNGAMAVLHAVRAGPGPAASFRSAVALYPGCAAFGRKPYRASTPLLIQAGGADDWTPARHCVALAESASGKGAKVEIDVYPDAHHAFDWIDGSVRFRADVRNPTAASGWGATVGPNPEARAKARERVLEFLARP